MPPTAVPILLLDVDGVLNAARRDRPEGWERGTFNGYVLSWDPTITARLRELHESGRVELQWLTTWTTDADELLAEPMGLPRGLRTHAREDAAPTGFSGPLGSRAGWWKLGAARDVALENADRRIVWIDDDLAQQADDTANWLAANPHVLVVAPDLTTGLTHEQLDRVEAWLAQPDPGSAQTDGPDKRQGEPPHRWGTPIRRMTRGWHCFRH